jgi:predicted N-acetyltransferase YhbS
LPGKKSSSEGPLSFPYFSNTRKPTRKEVVIMYTSVTSVDPEQADRARRLLPDKDTRNLFDNLLEMAGVPHGGAYFLINREGEIIGAVSYFAVTDDTNFYIEELIVLPPWRGTGMGRRLIDEMKSVARSVGRKALSLCSLTGAQGFYKHLGFTVQANGDSYLPLGTAAHTDTGGASSVTAKLPPYAWLVPLPHSMSPQVSP